jgi:hypothetical protein
MKYFYLIFFFIGAVQLNSFAQHEYPIMHDTTMQSVNMHNSTSVQMDDMLDMEMNMSHSFSKNL